MLYKTFCCLQQITNRRNATLCMPQNLHLVKNLTSELLKLALSKVERKIELRTVKGN